MTSTPTQTSPNPAPPPELVTSVKEEEEEAPQSTAANLGLKHAPAITMEELTTTLREQNRRIGQLLQDNIHLRDEFTKLSRTVQLSNRDLQSVEDPIPKFEKMLDKAENRIQNRLDRLLVELGRIRASPTPAHVPSTTTAPQLVPDFQGYDKVFNFEPASKPSSSSSTLTSAHEKHIDRPPMPQDFEKPHSRRSEASDAVDQKDGGRHADDSAAAVHSSPARRRSPGWASKPLPPLALMRSTRPSSFTFMTDSSSSSSKSGSMLTKSPSESQDDRRRSLGNDAGGTAFKQPSSSSSTLTPAHEKHIYRPAMPQDFEKPYSRRSGVSDAVDQKDGGRRHADDSAEVVHSSRRRGPVSPPYAPNDSPEVLDPTPSSSSNSTSGRVTAAVAGPTAGEPVGARAMDGAGLERTRAAQRHARLLAIAKQPRP